MLLNPAAANTQSSSFHKRKRSVIHYDSSSLSLMQRQRNLALEPSSSQHREPQLSQVKDDSHTEQNVHCVLRVFFFVFHFSPFTTICCLIPALPDTNFFPITTELSTESQAIASSYASTTEKVSCQVHGSTRQCKTASVVVTKKLTVHPDPLSKKTQCAARPTQ